MNPPSTAREALIAEALGDVARLIDRVEALTPAMDKARQYVFTGVPRRTAHRMPIGFADGLEVFVASC